MQRLFILFFCALAGSALLMASEQSGTVRAADQFIPGAAVTATLGDTKVTVFTNEAGRYSMDLSPGLWQIQVQMFGFIPLKSAVSVSNEPARIDWTLEMPRPGEPSVFAPSAAPAPTATAPATSTPAPAVATPPTAAAPGPNRAATPAKPTTSGPAAAAAKPPAGRGAGNGRGRGAQAGNPQQPRPGFQGATVAATADGQEALAAAAAGGAGFADLGVEAENPLAINGTISGGLGAALDDEQRRLQFENQFGGPGGPGRGGFPGNPGFASLDGGDSIGLGGLGAAAINADFGGGPGGGPGFGDGGGRGGRGGPGGPGGRGGGPGGGGPGGGGPGGGGGARGGGGGGGGRGGGRGGPNGGGRGGRGNQFNTFGNNRRNPPRYQGTIGLQLQNSAFNAAPYSLNGQSSVKAASNSEQINATIGGPLVIPKLLNLTRSQFTLTYQGALQNTGGNPTGSVPTPDMLAGNFAQSLRGTPLTIYDPASDPLNRTPFPNNQIPLNRMDPVALGLLGYIPGQTYPGLVQNYRLITSNPGHNNNFGIRLNQPLTNKDRLNFNVQTQSRYAENQQTFGFLDNSSGSGLSAQAGWSHSFAARFNNNANLTLSRNLTNSTPFFAYSSNVAGALGINGTSQDPLNYGPPSVSFTNFTSLSDGTASINRSQTINFTNQVTYVFKRVHNLQFGAGYQRLQQNTFTNGSGNQNARGSFSFNGQATSLLDAAGKPVPGTGYDFADFLLGLPSTTAIRFPTNDYFRGSAINFFAQDDYRINRSLSVNLGLRYDYFSPYTEKYGHIANLEVNPSFTQAAVVTPGQISPLTGATLPNSLINNDNNNFSPRIGFAYRPSQKDSTVLRGGYSLTYRGSTYQQIVSQMSAQPPFTFSENLSTSATNLLTLRNGFPVLANQLTNTYAINPDYKLPYDTTWDFTIQHNLPQGMLMEVEYTGNKGTHMGVTEPLTPSNGVTIPNISGFNYQTYGANSIYHGGVTRLTRRFNQGVSFTFSYTYSKSIDDIGSSGSTVQYIRDWSLERALSSTDQRHRLSLTFQLSSPVGVRGILRNGGWKEHALTGWTLNGTLTGASGTPLTPTLGGNLANTGGLGALGGSSRAQATGLPVESDGSNPYFNLAAFTTPAAGQFGNAGRNTIPGPFTTSFNAQLNRAFRLGEGRKTLQFQLMANNALNHIVINRFGTQVGSANYGLPTGTNGTRTMRMNLRFNF